jgi:hypothetical protein
MPSSTGPSTTITNRGRFELPVLAPLDSLTAGTDIPPPLESPVEAKTFELPTTPETEKTTSGTEDASSTGHTNANGIKITYPYNGRGRKDDVDGPLSPASSTKPSSIRRFLSRRSLNSSYNNGSNNIATEDDLGFRPESPSAFSTVSRASINKKRSSSWFRRFTGSGLSESGNKRTSIVYEEEKAVGPPPPKLPELNQLKAKVEENDGGSLGAEDMFKNIK